MAYTSLVLGRSSGSTVSMSERILTKKLLYRSLSSSSTLRAYSILTKSPQYMDSRLQSMDISTMVAAIEKASDLEDLTPLSRVGSFPARYNSGDFLRVRFSI